MKVFIEEQKFTQKLVIIGLSLAFIAIGFSIVKDWKNILNGSPSEILEAFIGLIIILLVSLLFANLKLKTRIDEKGIQYQYYPLQFSYKLIKWSEISKCYIRNYDAIFEYGGWGMKFSFRKKRGKSFTVKGNIGLQIELKTGHKVLIGTQQKGELQRVLNTYQLKIKI